MVKLRNLEGNGKVKKKKSCRLTHTPNIPPEHPYTYARKATALIEQLLKLVLVSVIYVIIIVDIIFIRIGRCG